jgi:oxygen-independent coproporphyrinogen-3 oxidase
LTGVTIRSQPPSYLAAMIESSSIASLIAKYDVPTPRYTSYPTVPFWNTTEFSQDAWIKAVKKSFDESNSESGISLYIHLPFCESLCTYCACNKRITKNHNVEISYIRSLLKEWGAYLAIFEEKPVIRELHLGGGTPTFFSPENLRWLVSYLLDEGNVHRDAAFSFEGHPNNTSTEHLKALYDLGFRRVSFGVQDLDPKVQKTINRIQPFENLEHVTRQAREIGYESVSFDLIYGLPFQTAESVERTIDQVLLLKPDRVSFYSYAHVPWVSPGQRGYSESDLPSDIVKRNLYEVGRKLFTRSGYEEIGMDHFALPHDTLFQAQQQGTLHRNFMGYTHTATQLLIGLGTSAISDAKYAYAQNLKKVESYSEAIANGGLAISKGHVMTNEDMAIRKAILEVACRGHVTEDMLALAPSPAQRESLGAFVREGILEKTDYGFAVSNIGKAFIRNICSVFDRKLGQPVDSPIFSKSI